MGIATSGILGNMVVLLANMALVVLNVVVVFFLVAFCVKSSQFITRHHKEMTRLSFQHKCCYTLLLADEMIKRGILVPDDADFYGVSYGEVKRYASSVLQEILQDVSRETYERGTHNGVTESTE